MPDIYGVGEDKLTHITSYRTPQPIAVDGDLAKPAWRDVPRSPRFVDMVSGEPALYDTRVASRWDAERFYVAYWIEEPQVKATLRERDSFIWNDDDVELFVAGDDCYYELEINPANVVCDLRMLSPWPDKKGDIDWNLAGLETRVRKGGTGWTATAFLPWQGLRALPSAKKLDLPPRAGAAFRFNVFRIDRPGGKASPEKDALFAAWSKPAAPTFHDASAFRDFVLVAETR